MSNPTQKQGYLYIAFALRKLADTMGSLGIEFRVSPIAGVGVSMSDWSFPVHIHDFDQNEDDGNVWYHLDTEQLKTAADVLRARAADLTDVAEPVNPLDLDVDDGLGCFGGDDEQKT